MLETVVDLIRNLEGVRDRGPIFLDEQLKETRWSFDELFQQARRRAAALQAFGLRKGDRVALIIPDAIDFLPTFCGAVLAGVVPVPLSLPGSPRGLQSYIERCTRVLAASRCAAVILPAELLPASEVIVRGLDRACRVLQLAEVQALADLPFVPVDVAPSELCFLQFTSGSTADAKGVQVSHGNLLANARSLLWALNPNVANEPGLGVSWLPLFHDMGLIGAAIAPMLVASPTLFLPTLAFIRHPGIWMRTMHRYRATHTIAPNFGFALATRRARDLEQLDLSCVRAISCGAEPINARTIEAFVECHAKAGLRRDVIIPSYGLAEATLVVAFRRLEKPYRTAIVNKRIYEYESRIQLEATYDPTTCIELVSCGQVIPEHEIQIYGDDGVPLPEGRVGEIVVRGPSRTLGYFGSEAPAQAELYTGDLGFLLDDELYISGRKKDLIIVNGRNLYPQEIEAEVEQVENVRLGSVVAFSVPAENTEELVVMLEAAGQADAELETRIRMRLDETLNVRAHRIVLVQRGAIPKTSSGKLQRAKARERWLHGQVAGEGLAQGT